MSSSEIRQLPQNLQAEVSILGGILIDKEAFNKVVEIITPDDFYYPANAKVFSAMCGLMTKGEPIDVVTLTSKLKEHGTFQEIGGSSHVADLLEKVASSVNVEYHAKIVADQAVKRRLISTCSEVATRSFEPGENTEELLDYAEKKIFSLTSSKRTGTTVLIRDMMHAAFANLERRHEKKGVMTGIPSGFHDLDKLTMGFQPSDLIIVACRPSMGKTSFALAVTRAAGLQSKRPVVFFSLEMSNEQILTRLLAAEGKVDQTRIRSGDLTEQDWTRLTRAAGTLGETKIHLDDASQITALELRGKARRVKALYGDLGLVVVDYLQIMGTSKTQNRETAISEISRSLKALAKELQCPVIALAQVNRNIDLRQDKRPMMADLRESGAIEQDADVIIFLHRENDNIPADQASIAEFIVGKHRNGPRGTVKAAWMGRYATFENLAGDTL